MVFNKKLIILGSFLFLVSQSVALKCYNCREANASGVIEGNCSVPARNIATCSGSDNRCIRYTLRTPDASAIYYGCGNSTWCDLKPPVEFNCTACSKDLCNASPGLMFKHEMSFFVLMTIVSFFFVKL